MMSLSLAALLCIFIGVQLTAASNNGQNSHQHGGHTLLSDMRRFLLFDNVSHEAAIKSLVHVTFTRLACDPRNCSTHNSNSRGTEVNPESFLSQHIEKNHLNGSSETIHASLFSDSHFYIFCHSLLSAALRKCCGHRNHGHPSENYIRELLEQVHEQYDKRIPLTFPPPPPSNSFSRPTHSSTFKIPSKLTVHYEQEAYANRFLCIRTGELVSRYARHTIRETVDHVSTAVVKYITYGYNIIRDDSVCPIDIVRQLFRKISQDSPGITREEFEMVLLNNLTDSSLSTTTSSSRPQSSHNRQQPVRRRWTLGHPHGSHSSDHSSGTPQLAHQHAPSSSSNHSSHHNSSSLWSQGQLWQQRRPPGKKEGSMLRTVPDYEFDPSSLVPKPDQCYSGSDIYAMFNIRKRTPIDLSLFVDLCPVLLHQTLTDSCDPTPTRSAPIVDIAEPPSVVNAYLCGTLAVLVISLCSLLGALFLRLTNGAVKSYLMAMMLSLAVGCLVADAALHLLPEIMSTEAEGEHDDEFFPEVLGKMCALLASVYAFFVLELVLSKYHTHGEPVRPHDDVINNEGGYELSDNVYLRSIRTTNETARNVPLPAKVNNQLKATDSNESDTSNQSIKSADEKLFDAATVEKTRTDSSAVVNALERINSTDSRPSIALPNSDEPALKGVKSVAWMIVIGDAIHNFADGLAIGAAYSLSFTKGLSTSITVLCHEVPHELGDFAVLVSTGLSIQRAMVLNFVSSLTAFAGLYIGLSVGEQAEASEWIFAVGAGMFLYVALTDLVPECKEYFIRKPTFKMFFSENIGILLGYVAMLMLALYEDKLQIAA